MRSPLRINQAIDDCDMPVGMMTRSLSATGWPEETWISSPVSAPETVRIGRLWFVRRRTCDLTSHVVVGEVTDVETRWTPEGSIERTAHVAVIETVRGERSTGLDLHLPGGTIDDLTVRVEDVPSLSENGQYLLFIAPDPQGRLIVIGGDQGAIRLAGRQSRTSGSFGVETVDQALASVEVCRD